MIALSAVCALAPPGRADTPPLLQAATGAHAMVVTANPHATDAAIAILHRGGTAADAAIAAFAVLGLVTPEATGLGGGGFAIVAPARGAAVVLDGRETAPAAAMPTLLLGPDGQKLPFPVAQFSGRSVGVPGTVALFEEISRRFGRLGLARDFAPAIRLAREGFTVSPRLAASIAAYATALAHDPASRSYFLNADGAALAAGTTLRNSAYAHTLEAIARNGAPAFYRGMGPDIVAAVRSDDRPGGPGAMIPADLAGYRVIARAPVCAPYRAYTVCVAGPPAGGVAVLSILRLLDADPRADPEAAATIHRFLQADRLAFADRNAYTADPGLVPQPDLLDAAYLRGRAALITDRALAPGLPAPGAGAATMDRTPPRPGGTSHVSIVDARGNAVAATITVESAFGNGRMVDGFLLNNELTDFSADPGPADALVANRAQGGKRPRSAMAPTIVFDQRGRVFALAGSVGGASIIGTTARALMAMLDAGWDPQRAANAPHVQNNDVPNTVLEAHYDAAPPPGARGAVGPADLTALAPALRALGWQIPDKPAALSSGLSLIKRDGPVWLGGVDPRREGVAAGY